MDRESVYYRQVQLLVRVLPFVARQECFALKGGTAINLFVRDMPRLSVDIDLAYLPIEPREESLANARAALRNIVSELTNVSPRFKAQLQETREDELRIFVREDGIQIKVEVNPVIRGTVHPPVHWEVQPSVNEEFGFSANQVVSGPDLFGGKICAALDRQHPRDLFDVMLLLREGGFDRVIFEGFLVYLISHNRPIAEILDPNFKDLKGDFEREFIELPEESVSLEDLEATRYKLVREIRRLMTGKDKMFLLSIKRGEPKWNMLGIRGIEALPAVQWKLQNIAAMPKARHAEALERLEGILSDFT